MDGDRSLDEFLGASDDEDASEREESGESESVESEARESDAVEADASDDTTESEPEPAVSTAAFDPEGAPCEACGESVKRRWRDDGALVCNECKNW